MQTGQTRNDVSTTPRQTGHRRSRSAQLLLDREDLELALADVLEVLRRPEEHVDERAEERRDRSEERRDPDEPRVLDPPARVLEDPVRRREPRRRRTRTSPTLRDTVHALESKRLSAATVIRGGACRGYTRPQRRFRRSPARPPARRSARVIRSRMPLLTPPPRDPRGGTAIPSPARARRAACARASASWGSSTHLDPLEVGGGARRQLVRAPARAGSTSGTPRTVVRRRPVPRASRPRPCRRASRPSRCSRPAADAPRATGRRPGCAPRPGSRPARRSSRPGSVTRSAAAPSTGSPRNAPAAASATASDPDVSTSTRPAPAARASSSHSGSPSTTVQPGRVTASFSAAIASRVVPSTSVCSSETFVSTTTRVASRTFVASWRPPRPASIAAASTPAVRKATSAAAVSDSNCVAARRSAAERTAPSAALEVGLPRRRRGCAPPTSGRAATGTPRPGARGRAGAPRSSASSSTCRSSRRRARRPGPPAGRRARRAARASARGRSRPRATATSASSHATCAHQRLDAEQVELAPVALELRPLAVDDVRPARSRRSARSRASPPRARSPSPGARARPRRRRPPGAARAGRPRRRSALLVGAELDLHAAAAEDLRRLLDAIERAGASACVGSGSGHGDTISRPSARREVRPDLLGDVRHQRVEQREQALSSAASAVARQSSSPSYRRGLIASAYQSQKSSNVRW